MNALAQKTETTGSAPRDALSRETLQVMHRNFMEVIEKKARAAVPANAAHKEAMAAALKELFLAAARRHVEVKQQVLSEAISGGIKSVSEMADKIQKKDFFTKTMRKKIAHAAVERKDAPEISKVFGDEERIYLPVKLDNESKTREKIAVYLEKNGYRIIDYPGGYATDEKGKQQFKIGKLLKGNPYLQEEFMEDSSRTPSAVVMVISRNAEDIARMSAGRSWTSCMNPKDASFRDRGFEDIPRDIRMGSLVAYLIAENDPEINNPLARVMIKIYIRTDEEENKRKQYTGEDGGYFRREFPVRAAFGRAAVKVKRALFGHTPIEEARMYVAVDKIYGVANGDFLSAVTKFVNKELNTDAEGTFRIAEGVYSDFMGETLKKKDGKILKHGS